MIASAGRTPTTLAARYQLLEVVGRGGMGEVWSALDLRLDRRVAVKLLSSQIASDAGVRDRFDIEARSAASLNHPNVVSVFDSGEHDGVPFLVMELLPGRTLADEVAQGPLEPERARQLGSEVLAALSASHEAGVLHRDIKPGNVLLTPGGTAKVGDFGIAKSAEGLNLTSTGMIVGTGAYLAPERVAGQPATPQSDIYAVGVVLYEALSGRKPFDADTPLGMLRAVERQEMQPLAEACPGLDPGLVGTVERAMHSDPARRFASAADMAASLRATSGPPVLGGRSPANPALIATDVYPGRPATRLLPPPDRVRSTDRGAPGPVLPAPRRAGVWRDHLWAMAAAAIVVLFVVIVWLGTRSPSTPDATTTPSTPAPAVDVPAGLDEAISQLEEAVRP